MGHYCDRCGEKLVGGLVLTCCNTAECYCSQCIIILRRNDMSYKLQEEIRTELLKSGQLSEETLQKMITWSKEEGICYDCNTVITDSIIEDY